MTIAPVLATAPVVLATVCLFAVAAYERLDPSAFSAGRPRNSAEAAALGNAAEVTRRLRFGEDPTRVQTLRPEIISSAVQRATTLEAAMWARELEMIELLDREDAIVDAQTRGELACLATDLQLPEVADYLGGEAAACEPSRALNRVMERTNGSAE